MWYGLYRRFLGLLFRFGLKLIRCAALQPDLAALLDKLGKQGGRGAKSRIVNDALRTLFKEKGLL